MEAVGMNVNNESRALDLLKKLKVTTEYCVLLTKLRLMNEICNHTKFIEYDKFIQMVKDKNIIHGDINDIDKTGYVRCFAAMPQKEDRFKEIINIITNNNNSSLLTNTNDNSTVTMITENYFDQLYESFCDRLNSMESEYSEIVKSIRGE